MTELPDDFACPLLELDVLFGAGAGLVAGLDDGV